MATLDNLTLKTVFLVALATGSRRSEIGALTRAGLSHTKGWTQVSLKPSLDFLAKNQKANLVAQAFKPIIFPASGPTLGPGLEADKSLCPVSALKWYLDRTQPIVRDRKKLFISYKKGHYKEISPITISSWLKKTVRLCYSKIRPQDLDALKVTGHQVRALAASWAALGGVSIDQILHSCHWQSHNTFTSFYLKDLAWEDGQNFTLGPIVAAQNIIKS